MVNDYVQTPIMYALTHKAPLEMLEVMCEQHDAVEFDLDDPAFDEKPDMLLICNTQQQSPLHFAAHYSSIDVIRFLVGQRPEALVCKTNNNTTALEAALKYERGDQIIDYMMEETRDQVKSMMSPEQLVLHQKQLALDKERRAEKERTYGVNGPSSQYSAQSSAAQSSGPNSFSENGAGSPDGGPRDSIVGKNTQTEDYMTIDAEKIVMRWKQLKLNPKRRQSIMGGSKFDQNGNLIGVTYKTKTRAGYKAKNQKSKFINGAVEGCKNYGTPPGSGPGSDDGGGPRSYMDSGSAMMSGPRSYINSSGSGNDNIKSGRADKKTVRERRVQEEVDNTILEEVEEFDTRIGDAEDRVLDVEMLLETGHDVDEVDDTYVTAYADPQRKKKRTSFFRFITCGLFVKKKKVIGY